MPKSKLHTLADHDLRIFNALTPIIDLVIHSGLDEIFVDTPMLTRHQLLTIPRAISKLTEYLSKDATNKFILLDILEGTNTTIDFLTNSNLETYAAAKQIKIISSGDLGNYDYINLDLFHNMVAENGYNKLVSHRDFQSIFSNTARPHTFLYLNNNSRAHRNLLTQDLSNKGLLANALWSNLEFGQHLPDCYDDFFNNSKMVPNIDSVDYTNGWPSGLLNTKLYVDTYFSVVTETNPNFSFRYFTEKIYKVLMMGHPFILVSGPNSYKHLHDQGYLTFENLIDESFDTVTDINLRIQKVSNSIEDLCQQDLSKFLNAARSICEHNRNHFFTNIGRKELELHSTLYNYFINYD